MSRGTVALMTGPRLRRALGALPSYRPGRRPAAVAGRPAYKVSSNENHHPPLPGVLEAAVAAAGEMNRYPDMLSVGLIEAIAAHLGVPQEQVAVGPGSVGVLRQVLSATVEPGDEVLFAWRSFEEYPIVSGITGATPVTVPLLADGRHDLEAMAGAVTARTRVVLLCTPNNPTGPALHRDEVEAFLDRVPPDVLVVLDEAYHEYVRDVAAVDGLALLASRPSLCVLRTFSKAYGLAGLRVGYGVAHPRVAAALRQTALPFGVSSVAQRAAVASLEAGEALHERVEILVKERARVWEALRAQGWDVPVTEANFVWMPLAEDAVAFADACHEVGVAVRPFPGEGVRVTVAEPEANELFLGVAASWRGARRA